MADQLVKSLGARSAAFLRLLAGWPGGVRLVAHRTTANCGAILETAEGVSYTATIHVLRDAGLIEVGELEWVNDDHQPIVDGGWHRYRTHRARRVTLTSGGQTLVRSGAMLR